MPDFSFQVFSVRLLFLVDMDYALASTLWHLFKLSTHLLHSGKSFISTLYCIYVLLVSFRYLMDSGLRYKI